MKHNFLNLLHRTRDVFREEVVLCCFVCGASWDEADGDECPVEHMPEQEAKYQQMLKQLKGG